MMRRMTALSFSAVVLVSGMLTSCDSTKLVSSWAKPELGPLQLKRVVAMAVTKDITRRHAMEDAMVAQIQKYGVDATASYKTLEGDRVRNNETARDAIRSAGYDGAVVLRLVSTRTEQQYRPGGWAYPTFPMYYRSFWGYYGYAWPTVYEPGYLTSDQVVATETLVYDIKQDELVWSGLSETTNPESVDKFIGALAKTATKDMKKKGVIKTVSSVQNAK